jgi:hypothetical protein
MKKLSRGLRSASASERVPVGSAAYRFGVLYEVLPLNDTLNEARSLISDPEKFEP